MPVGEPKLNRVIGGVPNTLSAVEGVLKLLVGVKKTDVLALVMAGFSFVEPLPNKSFKYSSSFLHCSQTQSGFCLQISGINN